MSTVKPPTEEKYEWTILAGDLAKFTEEENKLRKESKIIEKHISTQIAQVPNPNYHPSLNAGQPQIVTTVLISALFLVEKKPALKKT